MNFKSLLLGVALLLGSVSVASAQLAGPPINYSGGVGSGGSGSCSGAFCAASAPLSATLGGNGLDNSASTGIPLWTAGTQSILGTSGTGNVARVASPTFTGTITAAAATLTGTLTTNLTGGGTQCAQVSNTGVLSGTGSGCGSSSVSLTSTSASLVATPSTVTGTGSFALTNALNEQSGTTYTILSSDATKLVSTSNGSAIAVTLPQATGSFAAGFGYNTYNYGAGAQTITPGTSTIAGKTTLVLGTQQGASIFANVGGNYAVILGLPQVAADSVLLNATAATNYPTSGAIPACANDGAHGLVFASHAFACASITGGVATSITVGTTTVGSGTDTKVLFDNAGVLGEYTITGTGNVAMSANPTFTGTVTAAAATLSGTLTTNLTGGGTQCVHASNTGVLSGTGSDCGSGGGSPGGSGTELQFRGGASTFSALTNSATTTTGVNLGSTVAPVDALDIDQATVAWWNTTDHVTNFEKGACAFVTNVWTCSTSKGGTGTLRNIAISSGAQLQLNAATANSIVFQVAASSIFNVSSTALSANNASGPQLLAATPSCTAPNVLPRRDGTTSGVGAQAAGNICFVAAATEIARVQSTGMFMQSGLLGLKSFTVSGLPTGVTGGMAYVTDAVACTFAATPTGGGSTFCAVIYNGSAYQAL